MSEASRQRGGAGPGAKIMAVAGHRSGSSYQLARFREYRIFFGARSAERLYFLRKACRSVNCIATDDGSRGHRVITELLEARLGNS